MAVAIHNGHELREEVARKTALTDSARLREEDPFTAEWTRIAATRVIVHRSRFEMDLNRPRERAIYRKPEDAWGLDLWKEDLAEDIIGRSLAEYDAFYGTMRDLLGEIEKRHKRFVVFDLHSYNHRRLGPDAPSMPETENPQVNLGTGTIDRARWGPLVDRFLEELRSYDFPGGALDVRENIKFRGGHFSRWVHETFPETGCALAIELKKFFMDEWAGKPDRNLVRAIADALDSTTAGVLRELERL